MIDSPSPCVGPLVVAAPGAIEQVWAVASGAMLPGFVVHLDGHLVPLAPPS